MLHELKTVKKPFDAVWFGHKVHELRRNDRNFTIYDRLKLREIIEAPSGLEYTGRFITALVTYITKDNDHPGLQDGFVIMSIEVTARSEEGEKGPVV